MQRPLAILGLLISLAAGAPVAHAGVTLSAAYSEAANVFQLLDCVSGWNREPGDADSGCEDDGAYESDWRRRFGAFSADDEAALKGYRALRRAHVHDPDQEQDDPLKNRNGFFATKGAETADPVASAFYAADRLEDAYSQAAKTLSAGELASLRRFHERFREKVQVYLAESQPFKAAAAKLNAALQIRPPKTISNASPASMA